jgi:hypothetical protein
MELLGNSFMMKIMLDLLFNLRKAPHPHPWQTLNENNKLNVALGLTCLQNNNAQQTSLPGELEHICHREPYFGPICLGQQCFPQEGLGPICPKKVATPLLLKEVEETSHSPLKSCKSFSF